MIPKKFVNNNNIKKGLKAVKKIPNKYWTPQKKNEYKKDLKNMGHGISIVTLAFSIVGFTWLIKKEHKK